MRNKTNKMIFLLTLIISFVVCFILTIINLENIESKQAFAKEQEEMTLNSVSKNNIMLMGDKGRSDGAVLISGRNNYIDPFITYPISNFTDIHYIPNFNYFLANPKHHVNDGSDNKGGTCTTVAVQMLLGYNNYYKDRRIIPKTGNGRTFLNEDYGNLNYDPAIPRKPASGQGCARIGTEDGVYEEIFNRTVMSGVSGIGQAVGLVKDGAVSFINEFTPQVARKNISLTSGPIIVEKARADIDAGRPIVLGMAKLFQGNFHVVPAYGYAKLDGVDGFLVHYGWGDGATQVWVPKSWFGFQIKMEVNHQHNYSATNNNIKGMYKELKCTECGCTTIDTLYTTDDIGTTITGTKYTLPAEITIPKKINETPIVSISDKAFKNNTTLTGITFESGSSVQKIGDQAFSGCSGLTYLNLEYIPASVGESAFSNCDKLSTVYNCSGLTDIGAKAFQYCTNLTSVSAMDNLELIGVRAFAACSKLTSLPSLNNLQTIEDEAFQRCSALTRIALPTCLTSVGERAFAECSELNIVVDSKNPNYCADGNIFYDKNKTMIIAAGKINSDVVIPKSVKEIYPFAFDGNNNLSTLQIQSYITIDNFAFANCSSLNSVYIDLYSSPRLGINAFYNDNFVLFVPYDQQDYYRKLFAAYTQNIDSIKITVTFVDDGAVVKQHEVYYGSIIKEIVEYSKSGYIFDGWYDNEFFHGFKYINGHLWTSQEDMSLYLRWVSEATVNNYIRQFTRVGTHYIQNAYNSLRSTGLSIVDIPKYYQSTGNIAAGFKLYNDSMAFDRLNSMVVRPLTIIVGYTKTSVFKELEIINSWLDKCDNIVIMGNSLFTFLKAMYGDIGLAYAEDQYIEYAYEIMDKADQKGINLYFPRFVNTISSDCQNSCGLREINNIPLNEIPFTTMDYNYPESLLRVGGTLVTYGYPIFYPLDKLPNGGSTQVNNLLEEKCLDFVHYNEAIIPKDTGLFYVKDWLNLKNNDRYLFYTDVDDIPTLDEALYQNIMVNGNIHSISDFIYRKEDVIIMRVECNVGKMGEVLSQERFKKNIAAFIPDLKYILDNFECKVILIGCNRVEKDKDWNLYEYSDPNFLNTCSEMLGAQFGFISFDVLDSIHSMRGQFYWTNNIDPYEKYYAF